MQISIQGNWSMCTSVNERAARFGRPLVQFSVLAISLVFSGCSAGPRYALPPVQTAPAYKELSKPAANGSGTWQMAKPSDSADRGKWWTAFNDPELNDLEEKASASNQQIAAAV